MKIEQQVDPVDEQAKAKAALTELFTEARNGRHMWWSGSSPISMGWNYPEVADNFGLRYLNLLHCSLLVV
jgi:hypothetical protein